MCFFGKPKTPKIKRETPPEPVVTPPPEEAPKAPAPSEASSTKRQLFNKSTARRSLRIDLGQGSEGGVGPSTPQ